MTELLVTLKKHNEGTFLYKRLGFGLLLSPARPSHKRRPLLVPQCMSVGLPPPPSHLAAKSRSKQES